MQNQYKMNRILTLGVLFSLLFGTYRTACASQSLPTYDLGETVVTATKTKLEEKKVPMSTEVITQEEMKEKGAYNVRDALKLVNGLDVQEAAMVGNNVSLRGMGTNATLYNTWYRDYLSGEGKNYTYSTTNFVVTKDLNRNTHLYAGVDNIFDKQFPDTDAYSINGRTWRAGVEFTF